MDLKEEISVQVLWRTLRVWYLYDWGRDFCNNGGEEYEEEERKKMRQKQEDGEVNLKVFKKYIQASFRVLEEEEAALGYVCE